MAYTPTPVPRDGITNEYLYQELLRVSNDLVLAEEGRQLPLRTVAPVKPREGMLVRADGTTWNPGFGAGYYEYRAGAWRKLVEQGDNLALGTQAPFTWGSDYKTVEGNGAALMFADSNDGAYLCANCYHDGTNWRYKANGAAAVLDCRGASEGTTGVRVAPAGTAGAIITFTQPLLIDNSGRLFTATRPAFGAYGTSTGDVAMTAGAVIPFQGGTHFNVGGHYSTSTSRFTAPVAGLYHFGFSLFNNSASGTINRVGLCKNGSQVFSRGKMENGAGDWHVSAALLLAANDYVDVRCASTAGTMYIALGHAEFYGYLVG